MKLYHSPLSSNCRKVRVAAEILDTPLDIQVVDLAKGEHKKPEYLKMNPMGLVPVLTDGDTVLWESNAIMQYLADKVGPNDLWPANPATRAAVSRWQCWESGHWNPAIAILLREHFFKKMRNADPDPVEVKKGETAFANVAGVLNQALDGRNYLVGRGITLGDISVAGVLMFASAAQLPLTQYPNIVRWYGNLSEMDAWQATAASAATT